MRLGLTLTTLPHLLGSYNTAQAKDAPSPLQVAAYKDRNCHAPHILAMSLNKDIKIPVPLFWSIIVHAMGDLGLIKMTAACCWGGWTERSKISDSIMQNIVDKHFVLWYDVILITLH